MAPGGLNVNAETDVDRPSWPWRGVAWIVALGSVLMAWGAVQGFSRPDILIIDFFAAPGIREAFLALWALLLANAIPIIAFLMGLRFWRREYQTPEYRNQAVLIMAIAAISGIVIFWSTIVVAAGLSNQDQAGAFAAPAKDEPVLDLPGIARKLNANLPIQLDDDTRALGVVALEQRLHFKYQYVALRAAQIDSDILKVEAQRQSLRAACSDPETRALLAAGVTISKTYVDKDHVHLATYDITKGDCVRWSDRQARDEARTKESATPSPDEMAALTAVVANAGLPPGTVVREGLISEGAEAEGSKVVYSYRILLPKGKISQRWIEQTSLQLPRDYCDKLIALADAGISAEWRYIDSTGTLVFSVSGDPESCSPPG
jgi:hypothetical protein